jgi:hypothetical protein
MPMGLVVGYKVRSREGAGPRSLEVVMFVV